MHTHSPDRRSDDILRSGTLVVVRHLRLDQNRNHDVGLVIGKVRRAHLASRWTYSVLFPCGLVTYSRSELVVVGNDL